MSDTTDQSTGTSAPGVAGPPPPPIRLGPPSEVHAPAGQRVSIGRAPDNDIVLSDLTVSGHHALLERTPDGSFVLTDRGSSNGTFVNGVRVDRAAVGEGSVISLGRHLLRFTGGRLEEYVD
ncbi:MAG TPA: FHA domain-containing protein, partial [Actinomycetota bacterium]|nr:FHA domain-containing protein [Actinomycetota bacterium]